MGLDDDVQKALDAQRAAERAAEQKRLDDTAAEQRQLEAAWQATSSALDELAPEIAETCKKHKCRYDYQRGLRRGWIFTLPGYSDAVFIAPTGRWHMVKDSYTQPPNEDPVRKARKAQGLPDDAEPLTKQQITDAIRPQLIDRANGKAHQCRRPS